MSSEQESAKCQQCGQRPATIQFTDLSTGHPVKRHLCEGCYDEQEGTPPISESKILAKLIGAVAPELQKLVTRQCPQCGINYLEFRHSLQLGCARDYEVFGSALDDLLQRMQGANRHVGRGPAGAAQRNARRPRLAALKRQMDEAVSNEDYERAAIVRDDIKKLEREDA